ncbi:hypothetical protein [Streptomyces sp. NBRC 110611]|nr:hypothetical protein [Streptomyces sp. NBRC 110611]
MASPVPKNVIFAVAPAAGKAPDLVDRDFTAEHPAKSWSGRVAGGSLAQ